MTNPLTHDPTAVVIVTGLSGAGISSTLNILQDFGFETIDNLPAHLLDVVIEARTGPMAMAIDVRNRNFDPSKLVETLQGIKQKIGKAFTLIYLDCNEDELVQRFSKTKRAHPMARKIRLQEGIALERELLSPLLQLADYHLDSSAQSIWQHQERLEGLKLQQPEDRMRIRVVSFSYGRGIPRDADLVFDVRFLRNPHYITELRERNGTDSTVANYVAEDEVYPAFYDALKTLLDVTLGRFEQEGKSYLTIAFGCTGGQHRSVALAEITSNRLLLDRHIVQTFHRELSNAQKK